MNQKLKNQISSLNEIVLNPLNLFHHIVVQFIKILIHQLLVILINERHFLIFLIQDRLKMLPVNYLVTKLDVSNQNLFPNFFRLDFLLLDVWEDVLQKNQIVCLFEPGHDLKCPKSLFALNQLYNILTAFRHELFFLLVVIIIHIFVDVFELFQEHVHQVLLVYERFGLKKSLPALFVQSVNVDFLLEYKGNHNQDFVVDCLGEGEQEKPFVRAYNFQVIEVEVNGL